MQSKETVFIGLHIGVHDTNISAYISSRQNTNVYYAKAERHLGTKHAYAGIKWVGKVLNSWSIDLSEIEEVVMQRPMLEDHDQNLTDFFFDNYGDLLSKEVAETEETTFTGGSGTIHSMSDMDKILHNEIQVKNWLIKQGIKVTFVDHHELHTHSILSSIDQHSVVDGKGNKDWHSLIKTKDILEHKRFGVDGWPFGAYLTRIGKKMKLYNYKDGNRVMDETKENLDLPGKIMGIQAYGHKVHKYMDMNPTARLEMCMAYKDDPSFKNQDWLDFIATTQYVLEQEELKKFRTHFNKDEKIGHSGGVALNVLLNTTLKKEFDIEVPPHCADEGLSIGALNYLGRKYGFDTKFKNFPFIQHDELPWDEVCSHTIKATAEALAKGQIVGWYQGHGEVGPRALGNRSILMDPTLTDGKQKIYEVKKREPWRPFGASVKEDQAHRFFDIEKSRYMLYSSKVKYSGIPAVTHIDGTCRHNTVTPEMNPAYYELLDHFERLTGVPVLLNTSLNRMGEPIAGTRDQAIKLFNETKMDKMVIGSKTWAR